MKRKEKIFWVVLGLISIALIYLAIKYPFQHPEGYCDTLCLLRKGGF